MERPQLVITDRNGTLTKFDVPTGSVVIGRTDSADVTIESDYVSRRHAQLTWDGSVLRITDLDSSNGTMVNGVRVGHTIDLKDRDQIRIGETEGYVVIPANDDSTQLATITPPNPTQVPEPNSWKDPRPGAQSVFVSYARSEYGVAQRFVDQLRARGWHVIIDQDVLQPGEVWNQIIAEQIAKCSAVLVLISPASAGSGWVSQELVAAINARRPVLPVVIDSYDIGETRRRFALLGDRQWLMLDNPAGQYDPVEMDAIAHHLQRLAAGSRPDQAVTRRERLGSAIMWAGIIGLVAIIGWYAYGFVRLGGTFFEIFTADVDLSADDPFAELDRLFTEYAGGITGLFITFPIALAAMAAIVTGVLIRRNARKRRLMGQ